MGISIRLSDITKMETDAVVNAANQELRAGGGVCGAIFAAAGRDELRSACDAIGHCDTGSAVITPGFCLKAKYIIHAVGPVWRGGMDGEPELLRGAYENALNLACENGCRSITFPLISAGIYGYPRDLAWKAALETCMQYHWKNPDADLEIIFAVLDPAILEQGEKILVGLQDKAQADLNPTGELFDYRSEVFRMFEQFSKKWALLTAGTMDHYNACTVSWGGMGTLWTRPGKNGDEITVYLHPARYTQAFFREHGTFTVSFYPESSRKALMYMGSHSGRDGDKAAQAGLTPVPMGDSVTFREAEMSFLCRKVYAYPFAKEGIAEDVQAYYRDNPGAYPVDENGDWQPHWIFIGEVLEARRKESAD